MIVKRADFITSMKDYGDYPGKGGPEVAFAGKSNVGKSSMINRLTNRSKLARTSATPGKTRLINVYRINDELNFIDLPGYGFAKVSKEEKLSWGKMMQNYFATTEDLCHVFHLVDIRHEPSQEDREMNLFLRQAEIPFTVVATKADKISRGARLKFLAPICRALAVQPWQVIPFSAEDGTGREELLERIEQVCYTAVDEGGEA
ncbi:MAG: ribosome biogenesis GTP-binding protein YihA/YsxC [Clostridiales bacterium]|nr:ribosome biogenesis GTP-binding protein YihA/YsxC [Clostridiales bacterium]MDY5348623.1 ribosome biogenesis GTP-binding protein YihA/YsxC [Candidatus Ventricola sp.]MDY5513187.1 ribosome biogenesis GTP-binding protein YihA/YsxC [Candidatus Ventricola sp.]